jgi:hypothetical protein
LKAALHQKILQLVKWKGRIKVKGVGQECPTHTELMRGKLSTLSVARLLLYADLLGAEAEVTLRKARGHAAT